MTYDDYIKAVRSAALTTAKKSLIAALLKKVPFLFFGPLAPLTNLLVGKALDLLFEQAEFAIYFKYTDLRVDKQGSDFSKIALENYEIQQHGTEDEKRKSEEKLINSFKHFISFHT